MCFSKILFRYVLLLCTLTMAASWLCTAHEVSEIVYVGSTPGDAQIKTALGIDPATTIDFIRWQLRLNQTAAPQHTFVLDLVYGVAQPNTLGFKGGGEKRTITGAYTISKGATGNSNGTIYEFKGSNGATALSMVVVTENLLHILTPQHQLMVGNGGWSYTLNRKEQIATTIPPVLTMAATVSSDTARQVVYDGRTPCQDIAKAYQLPVSSACFKIKWRLIFNRHPGTHEPTTYSIRMPGDVTQYVSGTWSIVKEDNGHAETVLYKLRRNDTGKTISLLVGDENVLFFLNENNKPFTGNADFSYTLNRKL